MEVFGVTAPSKKAVLRALANLFSPEKDKKPLVALFYIIDACNGQCDFCSQKEHVAKAGVNELTDFETQRRILASIRADVPNIYLMGGEPSIHPHFKELLIECENLGFDTIGVNTNAVIYKPEILEHADMLVLSLFSIDPLVAGGKLFPKSNIGHQTKMGMRVIENIKRYAAEHDSERTVIAVNKVVTGEEGDIKRVFDIFNFCRELGIKINIAPAIMPDNRPDPRLINNPRWMFLIDFLLKNMDTVVCSAEYLKKIRKFEHFDCTPNVVPAIRHNGDIDVPCPSIGSPKIENILEAGGVINALQQGREAFGDFKPSESCRAQCHKTCLVEAANLSDESFVLEALRRLFGKRFNGAIEGKNYSYSDLLKEFCMEDMHDHDSVLGESLKPICVKNKLFAELIMELSGSELDELRDYLSEIRDYFDLRWRLGSGGRRALSLVIDIPNQILTRPFTPIFQKLQRVLGQPLIADNTGARAMNRMTGYIRIINDELSGRSQEKAA